MTDVEKGMDRTDRDLDLAVELVNTYWVLASPPDKLTDVAVFQRILRDASEGALAGQLSAADLDGLRTLRAQLKPVFAAGTTEAAVTVLDPLLRAAAVPARLAAGDELARWDWGAGQGGLAALRSRLLAALATHLVRHGAVRLGSCHARPCDCVYVDRSRARTRRYCCDKCNDRAAAAAYRQRARELASGRRFGEG
jgi:predicted RNA-binding Zn ribbon-like protein